MSRQAIYFQNLTGQTVTMGINTDGSNVVSRGTDWNDGNGSTVQPYGTKIPNSPLPVQLASEGDPRKDETQHWGWVYFTKGDQQLQAYLKLDGTSGIVDYGCGPYNKNSSENDPFPSGKLGFSSVIGGNGSGSVLITLLADD